MNREQQAGILCARIAELDETLTPARAKVNDALAITAEKDEKCKKAAAAIEKAQVAIEKAQVASSKAKEQLVDAKHVEIDARTAGLPLKLK
ncbi:Aste57867_2891 [Aphanomyces stellatus]|uniref:Aste57867_2891 protein n=1 Tax=Aphanomyces stellatus TaxID=120398 RepID=A0A485KCT6_9STRA|nr:hypothetical protein As57867_002883 [Aphanomyces stellatus]VFT80075.1 Aste57867_2891 [Aphanomyces stellatus]